MPLLALLLLAPAADAPHWAWVPPQRHAVPAGAHPVDAFVRAKLGALRPAPPAEPRALIRRLTFDLTGLPPTPDETEAFVESASRNPQSAIEAAVDRLLASPAYGERWGRHWLDLARYADTNGFEHDEVRPDAWRYRDYVVRSLNADKPYDRFLAEQLAGDELAPGDPDALVATGFNLLGPDMTDAADQRKRRLNTLNDMTDTAGLVVLGMTLGCARCHDHKFEPVPQADYYRLQAFFAPAEFRADVVVATESERAAHAAARARYDADTRALREQVASIDASPRAKLREAKLAKLTPEEQLAHRTPPERRDGGQREVVELTAKKVAVSDAEVDKSLPPEALAKLRELRKALKAFDPRKPAPLAAAPGMRDRDGAPPKTFVLERGEPDSPGDEVSPGFPSALPPATPADGPRRLALARWLTSPDHPLTARVIVNRLWQHHFGRGLVATPSDFGVRGEPPTHPELLDWLARDLVERGWSLKHTHRVLLTSETYRQSCDASPEALASDPENRLLSHQTRRRLDAEAVRDALLAVSGRLDRRAGGPGDRNADSVRRSVYLFARRNLRHPFLEAFDLPDGNQSCPRRERSTTAPQALALLNSPETSAAAAALAARLERESPGDPVGRLYALALGRPPSPRERERAAAFRRGAPPGELCRALFNTNEFVYLD